MPFLVNQETEKFMGDSSSFCSARKILGYPIASTGFSFCPSSLFSALYPSYCFSITYCKPSRCLLVSRYRFSYCFPRSSLIPLLQSFVTTVHRYTISPSYVFMTLLLRDKTLEPLFSRGVASPALLSQLHVNCKQLFKRINTPQLRSATLTLADVFI